MPGSQTDELAALRAQVAAQQARLERVERRHRPRRRWHLLLTGLLLAFTPLAILAVDPVFSDLGDAAAVHRPDIQAIGNAAITTGFADPNDPIKRTYNPKGQVTREEMASFLARTAGLGGNTPVANARTAVTAQQADTAQRAANATQLDGRPAAYFQPAGQPIAHAVNAQRAAHADTAANAANASIAAHADNAALVGGYEASALNRIAFSTIRLVNDVPVGLSATAVARVALTIPGPAPQAVVVRGLVGLFNQPAGGYVVAELVPESGDPSPAFFFAYDTNTPLAGVMTVAEWVFVAPPGAHTYTLRITLSGTAGPLKVANPSLIATTHPFGANGAPVMPEVRPSTAPSSSPAAR